MDSDYDRKLQELQKYIPFLEKIMMRLEVRIEGLESTDTSSANVRRVQLDKMRSFRNLLLDKNKRMKMENLLKCEQALKNLYDVSLVKQKEKLGNKKESEQLFTSDYSITETQNTDLDSAGNKLKNVATTCKLPEIDPDPVQEISPVFSDASFKDNFFNTHKATEQENQIIHLESSWYKAFGCILLLSVVLGYCYCYLSDTFVSQ